MLAGHFCSASRRSTVACVVPESNQTSTVSVILR
jgi:hypothetical protein